MSVIYLIALVGVGLALAAVTLDSVLSVARKPHWAKAAGQPSLHAVVTVDRRARSLPFVGSDRRQVPAEAAERQAVSSNRAA